MVGVAVGDPQAEHRPVALLAHEHRSDELEERALGVVRLEAAGASMGGNLRGAATMPPRWTPSCSGSPSARRRPSRSCPLLALVIRSALQDSAAGGVRVAFSPLVTDVPIILVALLLLASLPEEVLGALGIAGGAFVVWLGIEALREDPAPAEAAAGAAAPQRDILRGALTNALSPHPWVFWLTVGAPILAKGDAADAALFLAAFYLLLIGAKVVLALGVGAGRRAADAGPRLRAPAARVGGPAARHRRPARRRGVHTLS